MKIIIECNIHNVNNVTYLNWWQHGSMKHWSTTGFLTTLSYWSSTGLLTTVSYWSITGFLTTLSDWSSTGLLATLCSVLGEVDSML